MGLSWAGLKGGQLGNAGQDLGAGPAGPLAAAPEASIHFQGQSTHHAINSPTSCLRTLDIAVHTLEVSLSCCR